MHNEKLQAILSELEQELRTLDSVNDERRRVLLESVAEIRGTLNADDRSAGQQRSLVEGLENAVGEFEGHYPTLTGIIGRLMDGLAQMGI